MTNHLHDARSERGFSLIEMLVSTTVLLLVTGAVFSMISPSTNTYKAQPETSDLQQRLRVGANAISQDLLFAGAGPYSGLTSATARGSSGSLLNFFSPILPYRSGTIGNDPPAGVVYRPDTITIMYVPQTAAQTTIREDMPQPSAEVKVGYEPGCPEGDNLCGFEEGMRVLIFDDTGSYDPWTVTEVQAAALHLQHRDDTFSKRYQEGALITQVLTHTYYPLANPGTNTFQLMHYDGYQRDEPLVDDVVALQFTYYGDPRAPLVMSLTQPPFTSYGPKPPALTVDFDPADAFGAGENCLFMIDPGSGRQVARIPNLGAATTGLVEITPAMLQDGPWCPAAGAPNRFDADMFRVRRVAVRMRVQVSSADLRGPAGVLFSKGGTSKAGERFVPDQEIRFEVAPRNLNLGR